MALSDLFALSRDIAPQVQNIPTVTPQQTQALNQLLSMGMQGLRTPYSGFEPIEQRYLKQFQQQTIPELATQFSLLPGGSEGTRMGGAFAEQLGSSASDLLSNLAALRSQYGLQQRDQMMNLLRFGLSPQFEPYITPGRTEATGLGNLLNIGAAGLSGLAGGFLPGLGKGLAGLFLNRMQSPQITESVRQESPISMQQQSPQSFGLPMTQQTVPQFRGYNPLTPTLPGLSQPATFGNYGALMPTNPLFRQVGFKPALGQPFNPLGGI